MESTWLNGTWLNESQTAVQNVNSTIDDILPTKNPQPASIDWASEKKAMYIVEIFLHCTFLIVGLFGNTLTIAVLVYKKWTNITSRHILIALALSDTTMLITHTFNQDFLKDLFKLDARAFSNLGCKVFYLVYRTSKLTSSWFMVFLCFERFVAVTFPLKVKQIITEQRSKIFIIVNYLIMTGFNIILSFYTAAENNNCKKDDFTSNTKSSFRALMLFEMLLYSVVPIILMSVFTPIIILMLFKHHQAKKHLSSNEREKQQLHDLIRTTAVLMSVVIAFIICVAPITVFQQVKFWQHIKKKTMETVFSIFLFREVSQRFEQINYSINFFLYIFTSPTFRTSVFELLHIKQKTGNQSASGNGSTKLSNITKGKENSVAQTRPEGPKSTVEPTSKETVVDQLVHSHTEEPACIKETEIPWKTTPVPTDDSFNKTTCTEETTGSPPKTEYVDDHMVTTCTEEPTTTEIPEKPATVDDHLVQRDTNEPDCTDIPALAIDSLVPVCTEVSNNTETVEDELVPTCTEVSTDNKEPGSNEKPAKTEPAKDHFEPSCIQTKLANSFTL